MRKSSRLWWLHGAILLSAVIGCKSANNSSNCGTPVGTTAPYGGAGGPIVNGGPTMMSQSYPGAGGMSGMSGAGGASPFSPSNSGYPTPATSSGIGGPMR